MRFNEKQQEAINHSKPNLLVAGAAGSGKTAVLVERVTRLILEGEASIDEMLVVTFTKAAASGMKEKIVKSVRKRIRQDGENGNLAGVERLKHQLALMPEADISTFDSFAQKIVRENFQVIDVDPAVRVGDENKIKLISNQALDLLLRQELEDGQADFLAFMDAYADLKSLESVKKMISDFYTKIRALDNPFGFFEAAVKRLDCSTEDFFKSPAMDTLICDLSDKTHNITELTDRAEKIVSEPKLAGIRAKLEPELNAFRAVKAATEEFKTAFDDYRNGRKESISEEFNRLKDSFITASGLGVRLVATNDCKAEYEEIKEELKSFRDGYKGAVKSCVNVFFYQDFEDSIAEIKYTYEYAKTFYDLVLKYDRLFYQLKTEKNMLDFNDFMHLALKALENEDIAEQYRQRFKFIFVDEYQDSNELQDALISRLSTGDNVFMVGDVKQSIYRFRQAEPALFKDRYHKYKNLNDGGAVIDLNCNYRSKKSVIDSTNEVFRQVMEGYDIDAELKRGNTYEGKYRYGTEIYLVNQTQDSAFREESSEDETFEEVFKKDELEALELIKLIKNTMKKGTMIPYLEGSEYKERPISYRDIVILRSSTKDISDTFKKIFEEQGIPLFAEQNDGYFETIEVEIFLNLLKIIDNTRQDVPLISVLFSSIFGFTAQDLAEIRVAKKGREYAFYDAFFACAGADSEPVRASKELCNKCNAAWQRILGWKEDALMMPLTDLIWKLYRETGYYLYIGALPRGQQRQTNLRLLVQKAQEFSETSSGIYAFLSEIDAIKNRKIPVPPANTLGENANAVRLMTIHKSKGLEFPVVLVTGLHKQLKNNDRSGKLSFNKRLGIGLPIVDTELSMEKNTILSSLIELQNNLEEMQERQRLLYVAFTRAVDWLILCGVVKDYDKLREEWERLQPMDNIRALEAKTYLDLIMPALMNKCQLTIENPQSLDFALEKEVKEKAVSLKQQLDSKDIKVRKEISERLSYEYPYTADSQIKAKYSVSELNNEREAAPIFIAVPEKLDTVKRKPFGLEEEDVLSDNAMYLTAAEKGTLYHLILSKLDFSDLDSCSPEKLLKTMVETGKVRREEAEAISLKNIDNFLKSDLAKRVSLAEKQGKIYKEMPFTLRTVHESREILVQGIIDCCFEEIGENGEKYFVLLDYKSNFVSEKSEEVYESFRRMYRRQIDLYEEALEKICGIPVKERYLFMLNTGDTLSI